MRTLFFIIIIIFLTTNSYAQLFNKEGKKWNSKKSNYTAGDNPIYIVDGGKTDKNYFYTNYQPDDLASLNVYGKNQKFKKKYEGNKSTTGYVFVITKSYAINYYRPKLCELSADYKELIKNYVSETDSILYIADGEILTPNIEGKLYRLNFEKIVEMKVISPEDAKKDYSEKGKYGVVIINSKKE